MSHHEILDDQPQLIRRVFSESDRLPVLISEHPQRASTDEHRPGVELLNPDILEEHGVHILEGVEAEKSRADTLAAPVGKDEVGDALVRIGRSGGFLVQVVGGRGHKSTRPELSLRDVAGVNDVDSVDGDIVNVSLVPSPLDNRSVVGLPHSHSVADYVAVVCLDGIIADMVEDVSNMGPRVHLDAIGLTKEGADLLTI